MNEDKIYPILYEFERLGIKSHTLPNAIGLWPNEMECLLWLALNSDPDKCWLEIGSFCGGSAILLGLAKRELNGLDTVVTVDIDFDKHPIIRNNVAHSGLNGYVHMIECDSNALSDNFRAELSLVFIDGFHSFRQLIRDFEVVFPDLDDGAFIIFHDVSPKMYASDNEAYLRSTLNRVQDNWDFWWNDKKENFRLDEAVTYIMKDYGFKLVDIPVRNDEVHFQETGLTQWKRGTTSPFNAMVAIEKC